MPLSEMTLRARREQHEDQKRSLAKAGYLLGKSEEQVSEAAEQRARAQRRVMRVRDRTLAVASEYDWVSGAPPPAAGAADGGDHDGVERRGLVSVAAVGSTDDGGGGAGTAAGAALHQEALEEFLGGVDAREHAARRRKTKTVAQSRAARSLGLGGRSANAGHIARLSSSEIKGMRDDELLDRLRRDQLAARPRWRDVTRIERRSPSPSSATSSPVQGQGRERAPGPGSPLGAPGASDAVSAQQQQQQQQQSSSPESSAVRDMYAQEIQAVKGRRRRHGGGGEGGADPAGPSAPIRVARNYCRSGGEGLWAIGQTTLRPNYYAMAAMERGADAKQAAAAGRGDDGSGGGRAAAPREGVSPAVPAAKKEAKARWMLKYATASACMHSARHPPNSCYAVVPGTRSRHSRRCRRCPPWGRTAAGARSRCTRTLAAAGRWASRQRSSAALPCATSEHALI
jgi:hypothetical protein